MLVIKLLSFFCLFGKEVWCFFLPSRIRTYMWRATPGDWGFCKVGDWYLMFLPAACCAIAFQNPSYFWKTWHIFLGLASSAAGRLCAIYAWEEDAKEHSVVHLAPCLNMRVREESWDGSKICCTSYSDASPEVVRHRTLLEPHWHGAALLWRAPHRKKELR